MRDFKTRRRMRWAAVAFAVLSLVRLVLHLLGWWTA